MRKTPLNAVFEAAQKSFLKFFILAGDEKVPSKKCFAEKKFFWTPQKCTESRFMH